MSPDDIAKARATIARMRTEGGGVRGFYAEVADGWAAALDQVEDVADRVTTICDEACGLQPVQSVEESLSMIERKLSEQHRDHANLLTRLAAWEQRLMSAGHVGPFIGMQLRAVIDGTDAT